MKIYSFQGVAMVHINEFAEATGGRTPTSTRGLIEKGNVIRRLKSFRDRSRLMIPVLEIYGFPFTRNGIVYHYNVKGEKYFCETCTSGSRCEPRIKADELIVPQGDD